MKQFESEGNVKARKNNSYHKLTESEELTILEAEVSNPLMYLLKICRQVHATTGTSVFESIVCCFLQRSNFSRKKLSNVAVQHNELLRQCFSADCDNYIPEMMVFVDKTGCDRQSSMRSFGYALRGNLSLIIVNIIITVNPISKGQHARNVRLVCRGIRVSAVAAVMLDGLVTVQCSKENIDENLFCSFIEQHLLPHL